MANIYIVSLQVSRVSKSFYLKREPGPWTIIYFHEHLTILEQKNCLKRHFSFHVAFVTLGRMCSWK